VKSAATVEIVRKNHVAGKRQDATGKEQNGAEGHYEETLAMMHHESSDFGAMQFWGFERLFDERCGDFFA
jgi:hypothetical protein